VFDNEHSLHLWKRHPCTSTVEKQLTDWREQVTNMTWPAWILVYSQKYVCLLIQSNCIELQPSINILIWVAWLIDHPIFPNAFFTTLHRKEDTKKGNKEKVRKNEEKEERKLNEGQKVVLSISPNAFFTVLYTALVSMLLYCIGMEYFYLGKIYIKPRSKQGFE
jgi:hypothetical protein